MQTYTQPQLHCDVDAMASERDVLPRACDMKGLTELPGGSSVVGGESQAGNMLKEESWETRRRKIPLRVDVEWLDFEHFKNRYTEKDGMAIIEVLVGHSQISQEVSAETARRARGKKDIRTPTPNPKLIVDGDSYWMQRIRIQSPQLILLLSRLTGHHDQWPTDKPRTFFAPFRCFYYYLQQLKECIKILKSHLPVGEAPTSSVGRAVLGVIDSQVTLAHLTRFVVLIEKHIVPLWNRATDTNHRMFRFSDLWMAFQPGELLYCLPQNTKNDQNIKMYQTAWRLLTPVLTSEGDVIWKTPNVSFDIHAYYIDYDGVSYVPIYHKFIIQKFEGERDITTFNIFPLRFIKDGDIIKDALREQGTRFRQAITEKYLSYDGWTLICGPVDDSSDSGKSLPVEHVDGDVIIDFAEGYKSEARLVDLAPTSRRRLGDYDYSKWFDEDDGIWIVHWKPFANGDRLEKHFDIRERIQSLEKYTEKLATEHVSRPEFLKKAMGGERIEDLDEDDLLLLPRRVIAYSLRERRFMMLDTQSLTRLSASDNAFNDLMIDSSHRVMIMSLVKSHLEKRTAQKLRPTIGMNQDLIRGKGSGLVILLHGVPGVGKTATAEAIAQTNKMPLFTITCGDLGFTPKEVEDSLKDIFRVAHLWDCVLLLDEADIFLARRELGDLKRNALVSVFLRVLEYYRGILFLTTNRVGTLDEAFKSRIHVSLYYPPLSRSTTIDIFKVNIRKLQEIMDEKEKLQAELDSTTAETRTERPPPAIDPGSILHYAKWHYDNNEASPEQRWNGRQIRNAFQIAYSLAQFEKNNGELRRGDEAGDRLNRRLSSEIGLLNWYHFDMVAQAVEKFESYLYDATNGTDGDRARRTAIRADGHDYRMASQKPTYNPLSRQRNQLVRRPGQSTAPSPSPSHSRQYQPPRPAAGNEQSPRGRNPQGRPEHRSLNGSGGGGTPRRNPNIGGLSGRTSSGTASPQYTPSRQRQQPARAAYINHPGNKAPRPATSRRSNPGHHSGWEINAGAPGTSGDCQEDVAYDSEENEGYGVEGGENYEDDYFGNVEEDLDGVGDDQRYTVDGADAEPYDDYDDDMTAGSYRG
ncbi:hypothetical protein GGR51DRAFT_497428 [Nemania sp. FL0031]|nr:hypothetical protein GGR51DRAFT_497428 [Nemania sp. FL0031]